MRCVLGCWASSKSGVLCSSYRRAGPCWASASPIDNLLSCLCGGPTAGLCGECGEWGAGSLLDEQRHILPNVERAKRPCNVRTSNGEYRGLGMALAAPMEHVERHGHVHAVVAKWLRQELVCARKPTQQRVSVGGEPRRRAGRVALLVDEGANGRFEFRAGRLELPECARDELIRARGVLGHERHQFDGPEARDALRGVQARQQALRRKGVEMTAVEPLDPTIGRSDRDPDPAQVVDGLVQPVKIG